MKIIIALLVATAPLMASAQVATVSISNCSYWNFSSSGYTCSSFPMMVYVPDSYSLNNKIQQLESRIADLETKINQLTAK